MEGRRFTDIGSKHSDLNETIVDVVYAKRIPISTPSSSPKQPVTRVASVMEADHETAATHVTGSQRSRAHHPQDHLDQFVTWHHLQRFFHQGAAKLPRYPENLIHVLIKHDRGKRMRKRLGAQALVCALVVLIFQQVVPLGAIAQRLQNTVATRMQAGYTEIDAAQKSIIAQDFDDAHNHFAKAESIFAETLGGLRQTGQASNVLPYVVNSSEYSVAQSLLSVAIAASRAGIAGADLGKISINLLHHPAVDTTDDPFNKASTILKGLVEHNREMIDLAITMDSQLADANRILHSYAIDSVQNKQLENARLAAWQYIPPLALAASNAVDTLKNIGPLLGQDRNRRYLFLFLNNTELRPGGGFIGSFATFLLKKGSIDGFNVETNIYKLDHTFSKVSHIDAPYPITQLTKDWLMHDANWDTDYQTSAKKVAWFYKQEAGIDVDGVLSIDTSFIQNLLQKTGPVEVPNQNMTLTADNVVNLLEYKSEKEYLENPAVNALNQPKQAIADAFPYILSKAFALTEDHPEILLDLFSNNTKQKHLLFAPFFEAGEHLATKAHLDSSLPHGDDFVMVNNGNLGGLKSSLNVDQKVDITLTPTDHQTLLHTVEITRSDHGSHNWPDGDNHNFIRLMVPKDAVYIESSSSGKEYDITEPQAYIEQLNQYQTFGHWMTTNVGATTTAHFKYETPLTSSLLRDPELKFHYLKQPGWTEDNLTVHFVNASPYRFTVPGSIYHAQQNQDAFWQIPLTRM